jgi:hypothetical protein
LLLDAVEQLNSLSAILLAQNQNNGMITKYKQGGNTMRALILLIIGLLSNPLLSQDTELIYYRPFTATSKHISPQVKFHLKGNCYGQAKTIKREDAWQCTVEGKVYDPCFVKDNGSHKSALCPNSPWSAESTEIQVEYSLEDNNHEVLDMSKTYPWVVELVDGIKCQAILDQPPYDNMPIHYVCEDKSFLMGRLQRCASPWSILRKSSGNALQFIELAKAWF